MPCSQTASLIWTRISLSQSVDESRLLVEGPVRVEAERLPLKSQPALHDSPALGRVERRGDGDSQREAVEQLRTKRAFFRIHAAEQHKLGRVRGAQAFAFHDVGAA